MDSIKSNPFSPISSNLPIKGETYVAPALAAIKAWIGENTKVQVVLILFLLMNRSVLIGGIGLFTIFLLYSKL